MAKIACVTKVNHPLLHSRLWFVLKRKAVGINDSLLVCTIYMTIPAKMVLNRKHLVVGDASFFLDIQKRQLSAQPYGDNKV